MLPSNRSSIVAHLEILYITVARFPTNKLLLTSLIGAPAGEPNALRRSSVRLYYFPHEKKCKYFSNNSYTKVFIKPRTVTKLRTLGEIRHRSVATILWSDATSFQIQFLLEEVRGQRSKT